MKASCEIVLDQIVLAVQVECVFAEVYSGQIQIAHGGGLQIKNTLRKRSPPRVRGDHPITSFGLNSESPARSRSRHAPAFHAYGAAVGK